MDTDKRRQHKADTEGEGCHMMAHSCKRQRMIMVTKRYFIIKLTLW